MLGAVLCPDGALDAQSRQRPNLGSLGGNFFFLPFFHPPNIFYVDSDCFSIASFSFLLLISANILKNSNVMFPKQLYVLEL